MIKRFTVTGKSMEPTYREGDVVLTTRFKKPHVGDVIVVPDPRANDRLLLKRIIEESDEAFAVAGDNRSASTDSRTFGTIQKNTVRGTVFYP